MSEFLMWAGSIIATGLFSLIGWVFAMVFGMIKSLQKDHNLLKASLSDHQLYSAREYATKKEMMNGFDRVLDKLERIEEKLSHKMDREA